MQCLANGNIKPGRFVILDTSNNGMVLQCGSNGLIWGVSQLGTMLPPLSDGVWNIDNGYAAIAGWELNVFRFDDGEGGMEIGVYCGQGGSVSRGDYLGSDSDGCAVTVTTSGDYYGAIALRSATAGQLIPVSLIPLTAHV